MQGRVVGAREVDREEGFGRGQNAAELADDVLDEEVAGRRKVLAVGVLADVPVGTKLKSRVAGEDLQ